MFTRCTERTRGVIHLPEEAVARQRHAYRTTARRRLRKRQDGETASARGWTANGRAPWVEWPGGTRCLLLLGLLLGALGMAGCYDGQDQEGQQAETAQPPVQSTAALAVSFVVDIQPILTQNCATVGCHNATTQASGLNLEVGVALANTVNVPSRQVPAQRRIVPGDPDNSYLFRKIIGAAGITGTRMPRNNPTYFDQNPALLAMVRKWIQDGAQPLSVNFAQDMQPIFTQSCALSGCHNATTQALGLNLEAGVAFDNIVEVPSRQLPTQPYIAQGDPDDSYLFRKITGAAGISGNRMPRNNPTYFDQNPALLAVVRKWIQEGALQE